MNVSVIGALCVAWSSLLLTGCSTGDPDQADKSAAIAEPVDINALLATADIKRGQMLYFQCRACHSLQEGGSNRVGPNLHGLFGSKAGFATEYGYSEVLANADIVWTPETLDPWLARPSEYLPGNRMVFVGIRNPQDRANLIAFLQGATSKAIE